MSVHLASIIMMSAARHLTMAACREIYEGNPGWELEEALSELSRTCAELGYVLVKPATASEAAAFAAPLGEAA